MIFFIVILSLFLGLGIYFFFIFDWMEGIRWLVFFNFGIVLVNCGVVVDEEVIDDVFDIFDCWGIDDLWVWGLEFGSVGVVYGVVVGLVKERGGWRFIIFCDLFVSM